MLIISLILAESFVKSKLFILTSPLVGNINVEATVEGTIVKQGKQKKITIFRYTPNKRSTRRKVGHRQPYTKVEINKIK